MLYLYLDTNQIKLMYLKKSLLGQYETSFYKMSFETPLLENGSPTNVDVVDSAVKKLLESVPENPLKDRDVTLILPQDVFLFFRTDLPLDITPQVLDSYINEKAKATLGPEIDNAVASYLVSESENTKKVTYYAVKKDKAQLFEEPLKLLNLKLVNIIPESLAYYKMFEKTLRANKTENVWYVSYDNDRLLGYLYDSFGLLENTKWSVQVTASTKIESLLQKSAAEYVAKNIKLNRLILSGKQSEGIRQDTFTKEVGVWTNPLFRIIPHFYADYVKLLERPGTQLPVLEYDSLIGAFIFSQENKQFSLFQKNKSTQAISGSVMPTLQSSTLSGIPTTRTIPWRNILLFAGSFIVTFGLLYVLSQMDLKSLTANMPSIPKIPFLTKNTPTPTAVKVPTVPPATPTPTVDRKLVKVKILNGSGIAGKASVVKNFLMDLGYEDILTGNADNYDYEKTVIQIKKDKEKTLKPLLSQDVKSQTAVATFETLDAEEAADVIIIIGTDFK